MEKAFRDFIRRAFEVRMKSEANFKKVKAPSEFTGELSGSQFFQWASSAKAVTMAVVFSQRRDAIGIRLYWSPEGAKEIAVTGSVELAIDLWKPLPSIDELTEMIRHAGRCTLHADGLIRREPNPWYNNPFPPRDRIEPVIQLPEIQKQIAEHDPDASGENWQGNKSWNTWILVKHYAGPLNEADATFACQSPIDSMLEVIETYLLPVSIQLME